MDLGYNVLKFIGKILPGLIKILLTTGFIFPAGLYLLEQIIEFKAPAILYIICWGIAIYIFIKNGTRWARRYFA